LVEQTVLEMGDC